MQPLQRSACVHLDEYLAEYDLTDQEPYLSARQERAKRLSGGSRITVAQVFDMVARSRLKEVS